MKLAELIAQLGLLYLEVGDVAVEMSASQVAQEEGEKTTLKPNWCTYGPMWGNPHGVKHPPTMSLPGVSTAVPRVRACQPMLKSLKNTWTNTVTVQI
jgi:hypothetical protein